MRTLKNYQVTVIATPCKVLPPTRERTFESAYSWPTRIDRWQEAWIILNCKFFRYSPLLNSLSTPGHLHVLTEPLIPTRMGRRLLTFLLMPLQNPTLSWPGLTLLRSKRCTSSQMWKRFFTKEFLANALVLMLSHGLLFITFGNNGWKN